MTVPSDEQKIKYTGAGSTATYAYTDIKALDEADLTVFVTKLSTLVDTALVLNTDYTVTGVGLAAGGNVVLVNASQAWLDGSGYLTSSYSITIKRVMELTQETSVTSQGQNLPEYIEKQFDRGVMIDQQQQEQLDRSIKLPENETPTASSTTVPSETDRANTIWAWDSSGKPSTAVLSSVGSSVTAPYVVATSDPSLTNNRVLAGTSNQITVTDNGAGSNMAVSIATNPTIPGNTSVTGSMTIGTNTVVTTGNMTLSAGHVSITESHATTTPQVEVTQSSSGDAAMRINLTGGKSYAYGVDNSDGDLFALSYGSAANAVLGTNNLLVLNFNGGAFLGNGWTAGLSNKPFTGALNMRIAAAGSGAPRIAQMEVVNNDDSSNIYGTYFVEGAVLTTDGTITSLGTINSPGLIVAAVLVEANVVAVRTGGSSGTAADSAGYKLLAIYKNAVDGTLTQVGSTTQTVLGESQAGWDATLDASGNQIRIRVTGATNNNVRWTAHATLTLTTVRVDS